MLVKACQFKGVWSVSVLSFVDVDFIENMFEKKKNLFCNEIGTTTVNNAFVSCIQMILGR